MPAFQGGHDFSNQGPAIDEHKLPTENPTNRPGAIRATAFQINLLAVQADRPVVHLDIRGDLPVEVDRHVVLSSVE
jgi:hypothetical protein